MIKGGVAHRRIVVASNRVVELWVQIAGTVSSKIDAKSVAFALVTEIEGTLSLAKNSQNPEALTIGARNLCV
jgi:hypothetical protein